MVDIHEAFEQLLGKPYTIGTHPISERPHPYGSSRLPDLHDQARKASRSEHFVFKFTDEKNMRHPRRRRVISGEHGS